MTDIKIELKRPEAKELSTFKATDIVQSKKTGCIFMVVDNKTHGERQLMRMTSGGGTKGEVISVTAVSMFYKCEAVITIKQAI